MNVVDEQLYEAFVLRDDSEAAITGKVAGDFAVCTAYAASNPTTTATVTIAETSQGGYVASFVPTIAGDWVMRLVYSGASIFREWIGTFDVVTAAQAVSASPAQEDGSSNLTIVPGDDYLHADSRALTWSSTSWPVLTGATVTLKIYHLVLGTAIITKAGTVVTATGGTKVVRFELATSETEDLAPGVAYRYEVTATVGTTDTTLASGRVSAREG